ncbi:apolipoprotein N-acyltransferase [Ramlibacter sp. H39-3-26]|uniref:apolipoprotein N-acyltransferase n=1 Tax=Curvibacter soli TaxID=3031331 RepID=UPI0023DAB406|nr:apolipoprotein N-acyltransferase [Ramlibacter sp. H39-3-26]MDF1486434.1 apolipoprotein N-acyltransferase [Ramlibacter sp. H39-3-26]
MRRAARPLLALAAGLAQAASIASPFAAWGGGAPLWWLQLLSLALLAGLLDDCAGSARRGARLGLAFAVAWLAGVFWWLFISMHTYGGLAAPLAAAAVLALALGLALYYAAAAAWYARCAPRLGPAARAALFAAAWLLAELARGRWFTGFPWGAAGYAHVQGPLAGLAPWVGAYGVGAVAAFLAVALAGAARRGAGRRGALLALAGACAVLALPPLWRPWDAPAHDAGTLSVALLQGNIPQDEKFQPGSGVPLALQWYGEQLREARAQLVVAPETALPLLPLQLPDGYWDALRGHFGQGAQAALVGVPLGSLRAGYTNSVAGLAPGQAAPYRYDKHHLVPFGEFVPPLFRWFTDLMDIPLGDFNRGAVGQPSFAWGGQRLAPNVCYEDLFGEELAARFTDPAQAPTVFVNVSNIGWFGDSVAIDQHLQISRMRTLEFARPMLRATNTGATAIIDHRGAVAAALPRLTRGVLEGEVQGRTGTTPYAWWAARFGLAPLWLLGLAIAATGGFRRPWAA